jgi:glycosyltransferase involved in cell wall biosynthesis
MNVLEVIPSADATSGGPIEWVKQFAANAIGQGHNVELASLDAPDAACVRACPLTVHACGPSKLPPYGYSPRFVPWLRQNAPRYDIVVVNGIWAYHSFGTWLALRKSGTPYVVFTHGMLDPWFKRQYPMKHLKKCLYWPWSEYRVLRDASAVLFTSEEEKLLARESFPLYRCNEITVGNGTSVMEGSPEIQVRAFLERFPDLRGKRLALFMGRIHPKKGCDLLIQAFARTLAAIPDWHLVVAGPDAAGWKAELLRQSKSLSISERITWTGMLSGTEKWGALMASEIFLLPSHQENFGLVVAEALACGLPTLISNKVNIWREVVEAGAGLVAQDDVDGTCELMSRWTELTPSEQHLMRKRARCCFEVRFEIGKVSTSLLTLFAQARAKHRIYRVPENVDVTAG